MTESNKTKRAFLVGAQSNLVGASLDVTLMHAMLATKTSYRAVTAIHQCSSVAAFMTHFKKFLKEGNHNHNGVAQEDEILIYFSCHGRYHPYLEQYSLVLGAHEHDQLPFSCISSHLRIHQPKSTIIIVDACHSGAAMEDLKEVSEKMKQSFGAAGFPNAVHILASSLPSQESFQTKKANDVEQSVFTRLLVEAVERMDELQTTIPGWIGLKDICEYIQKHSTSEGEEQVPTLYPSEDNFRLAKASIWNNRGGSRLEDEDHIKIYLTAAESKGRELSFVGETPGESLLLPLTEMYVSQEVCLVSQNPHDNDKPLITGNPISFDQMFDAPNVRRWIMLVGNAGDGKSVMARAIIQLFAEKKIRERQSGKKVFTLANRLSHTEETLLKLEGDPVPVLITLRNFGFEDRLRPFIANQVKALVGEQFKQDLSESLFRRRSVLWILDGLEDVADESICELLFTEMDSLFSPRLQDYVLVTCQSEFYNSRRIQKFSEMSIMPLSAQRAAEFVTGWHQAVSRHYYREDAQAHIDVRKTGASLLDVLNGEAFGVGGLADLRASPLLLSVLCIVHRRDKELFHGKQIPNILDLYESCARTILLSNRWWKHSHEHAPISDAIHVLCSLAWLLQTEARASLEKVAAVKNYNSCRPKGKDWPFKSGEDFLTKMSSFSQMSSPHGVLTVAAPGEYGFVHFVLQKYFAACYAADRSMHKDLIEHFGDRQWAEIIILALFRSKADGNKRQFGNKIVGAFKRHLRKLGPSRRKELLNHSDLNLAVKELMADLNKKSLDDKCYSKLWRVLSDDRTKDAVPTR